MKVVILAGGKGTRISEESRLRPKPMVTIGGKPILWHIMKQYSAYGIHEFIICCGYKGHMIKEYFVNYMLQQKHVSFDLRGGSIQTDEMSEPWKVTLIDTGLETLTAGRLLKVRQYLGEETFLLTYGDGVADININQLIQYHQKKKKLVTISAIKPEGRFGALHLDEETHIVNGFKEKARDDQNWVNMGFMVMEPGVFKYLGDGTDMLEGAPFEKLAKDGQMDAYFHKGFWSPMDNIHDREYLESLIKSGRANWMGARSMLHMACKEQEIRSAQRNRHKSGNDGLLRAM